MTGYSRLITLPIILVYLTGLCGCNNKSAKAPIGQEVKTVTPADEKASLLKQLDRKFENPKVHFQLGQLYHSEQLYDQAGYHYNIALGFDPANRNAQAAIVKLLMDEKKDTEARTKAGLFMGQVASSYPESLKLARAFKDQNVEEYALACYQQALRIQPESAEIYKDLGFYHLNSKGDRELAKGYLTRSFQLDSNQPDVAGELGRLGVEVRVPEPPKKKPRIWDKIFRKKDTQEKGT